MPAAIIPTLTPEEVEDLIYWARAGELDMLQGAMVQACESHASTPAAVLAGAIDVDQDGLGSQSCLLHWPAANGNVQVVEYLLSLLLQPATSANKNLSNAPSSSPPVRLLLLVNHKNVSGNTPLHWAALNGHLPCVKALVAAGADASITNEAGHDAVYEAERSSTSRGKEGAGEVAQWILANCAALEKGTNARATVEEGEEEEAAEPSHVGDGSAAADVPSGSS
jgi:hypothetical protein